MLNHTYNATAAKYDEKALNGTSRADYPCQPDKQDYTEDVLDTWQIDTYESTHTCPTPGGWSRLAVWISCSRNGVAVASQAAEQRRDPWSIFHLLLRGHCNFSILELLASCVCVFDREEIQTIDSREIVLDYYFETDNENIYV